MEPAHFALLAVLLFAAPMPQAAAKDAVIDNQLQNLRLLPTAQRSAMTARLAAEIHALPAGPEKVQLAAILAARSNEGDPGFAVLQSVADTLTQALAESPDFVESDSFPKPYTELAKMVRYEHVGTVFADPLLAKRLAKAMQRLAANDADLKNADFTLKDLHGKTVTLSELRGKVVLVNFWATWCLPCLLELPDLEDLDARYRAQGLVVLAISNEDASKVSAYVERHGYHLPVLLDSDNKTLLRFHVDGLPRSYVYDRKGRLAAVAINQRSQSQFLQMLAQAGLQP
jgi:peroxiredoxin